MERQKTARLPPSLIFCSGTIWVFPFNLCAIWPQISFLGWLENDWGLHILVPVFIEFHCHLLTSNFVPWLFRKWLGIPHLSLCFYWIPLSLKWLLVPKSDVKQQFTTTTTSAVDYSWDSFPLSSLTLGIFFRAGLQCIHDERYNSIAHPRCFRHRRT